MITDNPDVPPVTPMKEVLIPEHSQIVVVNHWDWPFAWIMSGIFIVAIVVVWYLSKKRK